MKLDYHLIKKNLSTYAEAKEIFPIISEYEQGQVTHSTMSKLGLGEFANFSSFLKNCFNAGFNPVMKGITWRRLKPMLVEHTHNERFKKFIFNRTQTQFNEILNDGSTFDRYLNGRWVSKPSTSRRGRRTSGRRSHEHIEGFRSCIVPMINYIIEGNIDIYDREDDVKDHYTFFKNQSVIASSIYWYIDRELDFSGVPKREIDVTRKLLGSLAQIVDDSKIDFRKLNSDYIISSITEKISKLMKVPEGTRLKCLNDYNDIYGQKSLTKDQYYEVRSSSTSNGYVTVLVYGDNSRSGWFQYSCFEDVQSHRDDLLNSLFG
jgi:hypothetical protein